jgi:galactoside O-acetyltransferase
MSRDFCGQPVSPLLEDAPEGEKRGRVMGQLGGSYRTEAELREAGFLAVGTNVRIHERASVYGVENIRLGNDIRIDDFCVIIATGPLNVGNYVHVPNFCWIGSAHGVDLHDFVSLAPGVKIFSSSDDYSGERLTGSVVPRELTGGTKGKVTVGRHVIVGAGSVILPGCRVGEGCAVGALSLVNKDLEPWGIYAGIPVRRLKDRRTDLLRFVQTTPHR